jgi:hypothetical protein
VFEPVPTDDPTGDSVNNDIEFGKLNGDDKGVLTERHIHLICLAEDGLDALVASKIVPTDELVSDWERLFGAALPKPPASHWFQVITRLENGIDDRASNAKRWQRLRNAAVRRMTSKQRNAFFRVRGTRPDLQLRLNVRKLFPHPAADIVEIQIDTAGLWQIARLAMPGLPSCRSFNDREAVWRSFFRFKHFDKTGMPEENDIFNQSVRSNGTSISWTARRLKGPLHLAQAAVAKAKKTTKKTEGEERDNDDDGEQEMELAKRQQEQEGVLIGNDVDEDELMSQGVRKLKKFLRNEFGIADNAPFVDYFEALSSDALYLIVGDPGRKSAGSFIRLQIGFDKANDRVFARNVGRFRYTNAEHYVSLQTKARARRYTRAEANAGAEMRRVIETQRKQQHRTGSTETYCAWIRTSFEHTLERIFRFRSTPSIQRAKHDAYNHRRRTEGAFCLKFVPPSVGPGDSELKRTEAIRRTLVMIGDGGGGNGFAHNSKGTKTSVSSKWQMRVLAEHGFTVLGTVHEKGTSRNCPIHQVPWGKGSRHQGGYWSSGSCRDCGTIHQIDYAAGESAAFNGPFWFP